MRHRSVLLADAAHALARDAGVQACVVGFRRGQVTCQVWVREADADESPLEPLREAALAVMVTRARTALLMAPSRCRMLLDGAAAAERSVTLLARDDEGTCWVENRPVVGRELGAVSSSGRGEGALATLVQVATDLHDADVPPDLVLDVLDEAALDGHQVLVGPGLDPEVRRLQEQQAAAGR